MAFPKLSFLGRAFGLRFGSDAQRIREISAQILSPAAAPCLHCHVGLLRALEYDAGLRRCDHCQATFGLPEIGRAYVLSGSEMTQLAEKQRSYATAMIVCGEGLIIGAGIWAVYTQSWTTLIGGVAISALLFLNAIVARYRSWQMEHNRMFELMAPFADYIKWEKRNLIG